MTRPPVAAAALLVLLGGCERRAPPPAPSAPPPTSTTSTSAASDASARGKQLVERFECQRCHEGLDATPVAESKHCVHCHQQILGGGFLSPKTILKRWQSHIVSLRQVPSLAGTGKVLRREWVREFLLSPHDVRPNLLATMPRLALSPADADALARHLVPEERATTTVTTTPPASPADGARGAEIYARYRCGSCHRFTGAPVDAPALIVAGDGPPGEGVALAPDLALTRRRVQPAVLADFLANPQAVRPDAIMPRFPFLADEARLLAAYLLTVELTPPAPRVVPARLPPLSRPVSFDEISERVLRKVCWHCHSQPDYARGDGGPGNSGGFGFVPRGLDLSSATGLAAGAIGDDGKRHSVFTARADGTPQIIAHLLARQGEEAGQIDPQIRGMPLGLPSLPPEDIQLMESWIAQGRPR